MSSQEQQSATWFKVDAKFCESIVYTSLYIYYITAKTKLLLQLLPQLRDYPYYAMQFWKRIHAVGADIYT